MNKTELINQLIKNGIPEERILRDEPMSRHTSFRIGGPAALFITVCNEVELSAALSVLSTRGAEHILVGNGSNLLFADEGYDGAVIKLGGDFESIKASGPVIVAGGAALLSQLSRTACENSLTGLEFACGIPGSVGGAVFMNAGAYGGEIKDTVYTVTLMSPDGEMTSRVLNKAMDFSYRHSGIQETGWIVVKAAFELPSGDKEEIAARMQELTEKRNSKQPVNYPSAGSTFKRPEKGFAAALIEQAGLKGTRVGGAEVSTLHSGFIINTGGATCADVLALMRLVRDRVRETSGVTLEPEVRIIGTEF